MLLPATLPLPGGLVLPTVGLGTFRLRGAEATDVVRWALEAGVRHVDTAAIYKNEADVAAGIAAAGVPRAEVFVVRKQAAGGRRQRCSCSSSARHGSSALPKSPRAPADPPPTSPNHAVQTTKVSPYQHGTAAATAALEASIAALGEPLDLVLVHWPGVARLPATDPLNATRRRETWCAARRLAGCRPDQAAQLSPTARAHALPTLAGGCSRPSTARGRCGPLVSATTSSII